MHHNFIYPVHSSRLTRAYKVVGGNVSTEQAIEQAKMIAKMTRKRYDPELVTVDSDRKTVNVCSFSPFFLQAYILYRDHADLLNHTTFFIIDENQRRIAVRSCDIFQLIAKPLDQLFEIGLQQG